MENTLAIARAGSLLVEQGLRPQIGSAGLINEGSPPADAARTTGRGTGASAPAPASASSSRRNSGGRAPAAPSGSSSGGAPGSRSAGTPAPAGSSAPVRPSLSVVLVNETGRPQVGEDYRQVLSQIGYDVVYVADRVPSGAAGQTVVAYRSGRRGQASALARRLPGKRSLVAGSEQLPAEAVVVIR
ncbi:MAG: LytR C-terminal domain-containing protein [Deltaproteobacteria bacterium]|nr:LytR C-terminal domain-containing protein [Deltaproteobacteria bacterium]